MVSDAVGKVHPLRMAVDNEQSEELRVAISVDRRYLEAFTPDRCTYNNSLYLSFVVHEAKVKKRILNHCVLSPCSCSPRLPSEPADELPINRLSIIYAAISNPL